MVLLGAPLWLRSRLTDRFWRVQEVLKYARVSVPAAPRGLLGLPSASSSRRRPGLPRARGAGGPLRRPQGLPRQREVRQRAV